MTTRRPVALWRIAGGAALHFVVPAYVIAAPVAAILTARSATFEAVVARVPEVSGWFLAGYAVLTAASVLAAVAIDPLLRLHAARREARDPGVAARASAQRVARAISEGSRHLGADATRVLDGLRGDRWDHADVRFQALSSDLAQVVQASATALASAPPARRAAIADLTTAALARIAAALADLQAERGRLDEGDVHTVARYVEARYGPSDFAGEER